MTAFPRCPECNGQRVPMNYVGDVVGDVCYCGFARRSQPSTSFEDVYRVQTAEITRLRAEVDRLKLQRTAADIVGRETANIALLQAGEIEVLRADNKHLRGAFEKAWPDAERYRHLINAEPAWVVSLFENGFSPAEIVDLIDAARAAEEKK